MPIRAIIFDIGEVLLFTNNGRGRKKWADRFGVKAIAEVQEYLF